MTDVPAKLSAFQPPASPPCPTGFPVALAPVPPWPAVWRRWLLPAGALLLLVGLAYWPLLHAGFLWDDAMLTRNPWLQHWAGLRYIWGHFSGDQYYPLVYSLFLLQYKLWGLNALAYHLVNIALQAINALLLWRILVKLGLKSAWLIAAIFAIHPVQVETVGWVIEQKNLWSGLFYFAAVLAWLRFARLIPAPAGSPHGVGIDLRSSAQPPHEHTALARNSHWGWYGLATLFYLLALLAKTDVCTLPVVLLLLTWWKRGRLVWRDGLTTLPWFVLSVVLALITIHVEHTVVGARGVTFRYSLAQRLLIAGKALWFYPWKLIWPHPLLEIYPRWNFAALGGLHGQLTAAGWSWLYPATAFAVPVVLWRLRRKIGRGPITAVAFYGITIAPVLGFISFYLQVYSFVADHLQYLACVGLIALAVEGFWLVVSGLWFPAMARRPWQCHAPPETTNQEPPTPNAKPETRNHRLEGQNGKPFVAVACGTVILAVLGLLGWRQSRLYAASIQVWRHVLKYNPNCPLALEHVAMYDAAHQQTATALFLLRRAVRWSADTPVLLPLFNSNMADIYWQRYHNYAAAAHYYQVALRRNPRYLYAIQRLVRCYERLGDWRRVVTDLERGLREFPGAGALQEAWADVLAFAPQQLMAVGGRQPSAAQLRRAEQSAVRHYLLAIRYRPYTPSAYYNLAVTLRRLGRSRTAQAVFLRMGPLSPRALILIAHSHERLGDGPQALADLQWGLRRFAHSAALELALANALTGQHHPRAALKHYLLAVRYQPDGAAALYDLAAAWERLGKRSAALLYYRRAIRAAPRWLRARYSYGACLWRLGQRQAAQQQFRRMRQIGPRTPSAYAGQAAAMTALGDSAMALQDLRAGLRRFPESERLHLALANSLARRRKYYAAATEYRLVLHGHPANRQALCALAFTLERLNQWRQASACYRRTLQAAPRWAYAHFLYGEGLLAHGQPGAAAQQFRRALQLTPAAAVANRALAYRGWAAALRSLGHRHQAAAALAEARQLQQRTHVVAPAVKAPQRAGGAALPASTPP